MVVILTPKMVSPKQITAINAAYLIRLQIKERTEPVLCFFGLTSCSTNSSRFSKSNILTTIISSFTKVVPSKVNTFFNSCTSISFTPKPMPSIAKRSSAYAITFTRFFFSFISFPLSCFCQHFILEPFVCPYKKCQKAVHARRAFWHFSLFYFSAAGFSFVLYKSGSSSRVIT